MIVHIVMFKFREDNRDANIIEAQERLNNLINLVPSLDSMEVGVDFDRSDRAMDLVLTTIFQTKDDLKEYATHPKHLEVIEFIKSVTEYTKVVDYQK